MRFVSIVVAVGCLGIWVGLILFYPADSTDKSQSERSGMSLHVDHETGCHYLGGSWGGITPRVDRDGNHICREAP